MNFPINDWFDTALIGMFLFGLIFTIASILLGFGDLGADSGHDFDVDTGHDFGSDSGHDLSHADHGGAMSQLFNVSSIVTFLTWFSGATYLARNGFGWHLAIALLLGLVIGLAGAWLISWFLYSFLRRNSPELDPRDWDHIGQIGRLTSGIRAGGVGEMLFESHGVRLAIPARAEHDAVIDRDTEVVILHIDKGIATVQPWKELIGDNEFE